MRNFELIFFYLMNFQINNMKIFKRGFKIRLRFHL